MFYEIVGANGARRLVPNPLGYSNSARSYNGLNFAFFRGLNFCPTPQLFLLILVLWNALVIDAVLSDLGSYLYVFLRFLGWLKSYARSKSKKFFWKNCLA
jgi:hypothetical protein